MDKRLLIEAGHLASTLMVLADETGDQRIGRLASMACDRERRRWQQWDTERAAIRRATLLPDNGRMGRPDTKDRPRAGAWRGKR